MKTNSISTFTAFFCLLIIIIQVNCSGPTKQEQLRLLENKKKLPYLTKSQQRGALAFSQNCVVCHQDGGVGKPGLAPSINNPDFLAIATDEVIKKTILEGRSGTTMIPFKSNPKVADKIDDIVAYIRYMENYYELFDRVNVDADLVIAGDVQKGEASFNTYCVSCHGPEGVGYSAGGSGTGIGQKGFLSEVPDDYIKQTIIRGRVRTPMKSFQTARGLAHLEDEEINNIVAYLRNLENK